MKLGMGESLLQTVNKEISGQQGPDNRVNPCAALPQATKLSLPYGGAVVLATCPFLPINCKTVVRRVFAWE